MKKTYLMLASLVISICTAHAISELDEALVHAVKSGALKEVKRLLDRGADIRTGDHEGRSLLHCAADEGHKGVVKLLLEESPAQLTATTVEDFTPLHFAAVNGHKGVVKILINHTILDCDSFVNAQSALGCAPLHCAAGEGHEEVVRLLLGKGANSFIEDSAGNTPFAYASRNGHAGVERLLKGEGRLRHAVVGRGLFQEKGLPVEMINEIQVYLHQNYEEPKEQDDVTFDFSDESDFSDEVSWS